MFPFVAGQVFADKQAWKERLSYCGSKHFVVHRAVSEAVDLGGFNLFNKALLSSSRYNSNNIVFNGQSYNSFEQLAKLHIDNYKNFDSDLFFTHLYPKLSAEQVIRELTTEEITDPDRIFNPMTMVIAPKLRLIQHAKINVLLRAGFEANHTLSDFIRFLDKENANGIGVVDLRK